MLFISRSGEIEFHCVYRVWLVSNGRFFLPASESSQYTSTQDSWYVLVSFNATIMHMSTLHAFIKAESNLSIIINPLLQTSVLSQDEGSECPSCVCCPLLCCDLL